MRGSVQAVGMAQRRKASVQRKGNVVVVSAPAPRRRSSAPRRRSAPRRAARRAAASYSAAGYRKQMMSVFAGGFGVGLIEKTFPNLPTLPMVGRKGTIALGLALIKPKEQILRDVGIAAAAISGYELGLKGSISGDFDDDEVFTTT